MIGAIVGDVIGSTFEHYPTKYTEFDLYSEGIRGALAVASCIFVARDGGSKDAIRRFIEAEFGYDLSKPLDMIRPFYSFDVRAISCPSLVTGTVIFLESSFLGGLVVCEAGIWVDFGLATCENFALGHLFVLGVVASLAWMLWAGTTGRSVTKQCTRVADRAFPELKVTRRQVGDFWSLFHSDYKQWHRLMALVESHAV